jgi:crossover junction endodeoxyribonuclease RusA
MNDRHHWRRRAADVKHWRTATATHAHRWHTSECPPSMIVITFDVPDNRRRDPANLFATVKACVDGMVDAGWWPDDTPEYVTVVEPLIRVVGRKAPLMVTVELLPR